MSNRTAQFGDEPDDDAPQTVELRAEEIAVDTQRVSSGEARVRKEIVTEIQAIEVPVTHEELVIERHAASDGETSNGGIADEIIRIPLTQERIVVTKETVAREEVDITKRRVGTTMRISEELRHEELSIDGAAASDTGDPRRDATDRRND
ncbi:MAG: YsnF/AvaK domain-containing protein [Candidatus Eremiobacteraeota bacterium]|nr:YsnF/AvaK domain-containing protein [Candidatus Eremiobacteraeota bacterium]